MPSAPLRVPFLTDAFARSLGMPDVRLVNMVSEATPIREEQAGQPYAGLRDIHYTRPALVTALADGSGPVRGVYIQSGVFNGAHFVVSGNTIYKDRSTFGTVTGTDMARIAASRSQVVIVADGTAYLYSGGAGPFAPIVSSSLGPVTDVAYLAGRFVYAMQGTDQFYWSAVNDAGNIPGLNFATAESFADPIVGLGVLNEELVVFGNSSVEFWSPGDVGIDGTGSAFGPINGRGFQRGCASRDAIAFADNDLFWIADNRVVYRAQNTPTRVSSSSIEDQITRCADLAHATAFSATFEGHEFYVINLPGVGSYAYDASRVGTAAGAFGASYSRGEWAQWTSLGRDTFRARCAAFGPDASGVGRVWAGDDTTADLWCLSPGAVKDGTTAISRVASAFVKVEAGTPRCDNIVLHTVVGVGNAYDPGANPYAEMRYSDDQGRTFSRWRAAPIGKQGRYLTRAYWQRLGSMRAPGRLFEVRCAEPVNVVFSHLEANAPRPSQ